MPSAHTPTPIHIPALLCASPRVLARSPHVSPHVPAPTIFVLLAMAFILLASDVCMQLVNQRSVTVYRRNYNLNKERVVIGHDASM